MIVPTPDFPFTPTAEQTAILDAVRDLSTGDLLMDKLADQLAKIRRDHAVSTPEPVLTPAPAMTTVAPIQNDVADARAVFAAFLPALQTAMKAAARHERWTPDIWQQETILAAELIEQNHHAMTFIDTLSSVYRDAATPTPH